MIFFENEKRNGTKTNVKIKNSWCTNTLAKK